MCEECEGNAPIGNRGCLDWHPHAKLVVVQMGPNELGIAVDTKMRQEDVRALVQLLAAFRHSVEQLSMDSPIIELLVSQINRKQMSILLNMLKNSCPFSPCKNNRIGEGGGYSCASELVKVPPPQSIPYGPFFSNLKKLTITSQSNQLEHLSRLLTYAVSVDFLYETSNIDLLCLKICIGRGQWSMQKPSIRLFCHVTRFRQWTEAGSLGERYFQQFSDSSSHYFGNGRGGGKINFKCDIILAFFFKKIVILIYYYLLIFFLFLIGGVLTFNYENIGTSTKFIKCMPTTISVSPAVPDKLVVNGVDLINEDELSPSQHSGGGKGGIENLDSSIYGAGKKQQQPQSTYSPFDDLGYRPSSVTQSLSIGTPLSISDYYGGQGGKRKGVSWSDVVGPDHAITGDITPTTTTDTTLQNIPARSYSPNYYQQRSDGDLNTSPYSNGRDDYSASAAEMGERNTKFAKDNSPQTPRSGYWTGSGSPWPVGTWERGNWDKSKDQQSKWQDFPKTDLPTYSALPRSMDDFNRFQSHEHREDQLRKSQERDEIVKFYGYGDHRVSGLEIKPKRWQGGEVVTDPNIMKKSLKPRRMFYSPIGDGVVEADGIEMKYPPRDLTPRRYVYHQRFTEHDPGAPGLKVSEKTWHEGGDDGGPHGATFRSYPQGPDVRDGDYGRRGHPRGDDDDGRGKLGPPVKWPADDFDDGRGRKRPNDDGGDDGKRGKGPGDGIGPLDKFPLLGDDFGGLPKRGGDNLNGLGGPREPLDANGGKTPREGWQIEFISNPRECINIYGTDTITNIFDLEDHTPKTITTIKETYSPKRILPKIVFLSLISLNLPNVELFWYKDEHLLKILFHSNIRYDRVIELSFRRKALRVFN
ncbi:hypothetical protein Mgra_00003998 [Meloidogyne graminicola]|uniref:Uncharacterized protein n=1 Tax=Meloidogyne graminicola TaxID=189291 RepID=A0A8S9ZU09_9BILA|nr:hypothetical protein Mgra_00003998 [Meloidogyne graminicola]